MNFNIYLGQVGGFSRPLKSQNKHFENKLKIMFKHVK